MSDVGKCIENNCEKKDTCYRFTKSKLSIYDFGKICGEDYKWYIKDKDVNVVENENAQQADV